MDGKSYIFEHGKICRCKCPTYILMEVNRKIVSVCTKCQGQVKGSLPELDKLFQDEEK
jgi:hypothetical protein